MERNFYIDEPRANLFFNPVPAGGFNLVESGAQVTIPGLAQSAIAAVRGGDYTSEELRRRKVNLLLPVGKVVHEMNVFHEYSNLDGVPLFRQFVELETKEDILEFAGRYGQLIPGVKADHTGQVFLEPLHLWQSEISLVRETVKIWNDLEAGEPVYQYLKPIEGDRFIFSVQGETASRNLKLLAVLSESKAEAVQRGLSRLIDEKMLEFPATIAHGVGEEIVRGGKTVPVKKGFIRPTSLISAIWLQVSQSFFMDGYRDVIVRRCFLTGDFFMQKDMRRCQNGPFAGQWYSKIAKRNFDRQKNRRIKAAINGKEVKPNRKNTMRFLVDFDDIGRPVAEVAQEREGDKRV